ncbi:hypothetical protein FRC12_010029 [Ceratobasidium sp. 428]|nr:hypothetical protein FRC12_010029 [Ceratobasidium sp. 428]
MEAIKILQAAQTALEEAASNFLHACTTLKLVAVPSLASIPGQLTFENNLDNILSSIDTASLVENRVCESRVILKKLLNMSTTRVPVHKLPIETLSYIFSIVAASSPCRPADNQRDNLLDIPQVCVRWNRVAVDTPSLWSHIDINLSYFSVATALERARLWLNRCHNMPIHLHLDDGSSLIPQADVPDILAVLEPHAGLVCSLVFSSFCHYSIVRALLGLVDSGPLNTLVISGVANAFGQRDPSSRAIGLLRGLTLLDLYHLEELICPSLGDIADILSGSPALHTLRLRSLFYQSDSSQIHSDIPLPLLRFLEISGVRCNKVLRLLSKLVPGVLEMDVRLDAEYFKDDGFNSPSHQFLARSNIVSLAIYYSSSHDSANRSLTYLAYVPHLRVLQLGSTNLARSFALTLGVTFNGQPYLKLPCLRSLCFVRCTIGSWTIDVVEQITGRIKLHSIAFRSCPFPSTFTRLINRSRESQLLHGDNGEDGDQDEDGGDDNGDDEEDTDNDSDDDDDEYRDEMPQSMKDCFSEQVAKVVVFNGSIAGGTIYHGVDPFVRSLIKPD